MGQKGNCPVPTIDGYLEHNKENFQSLVDRLLENNPDMQDNDVMVVNTIYNSIMKRNTILADAFGAWAKDIYPDHISAAAITESLSPQTQSESDAKLFVNSIIDDYTDEKTSMPALEEQDTDEGDFKDDVSHENQASVEVYADMAGEEYFKDRLFSAINKRVDDKDLAEMIDFAKQNPGEKGFERFLDFIIDKYPDLAIGTENISLEDRLMSTMFGEAALEKLKDPAKLQALKQFHMANDPVNKRTRDQKKYWVITNWDGEKVAPKGSKYLMKKPEVNLRTQRKEPKTLPASFIDTSPVKLPSGKRIGTQTQYMSLNDFVELVEKKDGSWFAKPSTAQYSSKQLNEWLKILIRNGLTIATLRGGNSGQVILTKVDNYYYNELFPVEQIKNLAPRFPEKFRKYLDKYNNNMMKAVLHFHKDLQGILNREGAGRAKEEIQVINAILEAHSKIAISNYKKYIQKELDNNNIDQKGYDSFIKNIFDLPVEGSIDGFGLKKPYLFMGEYLASIMARHEWLKAVIGKDYIARGKDLEDIFNRMRLPASEGSVNRDGTDSRILILDEKQIQYRNTETGKVIEVSQKVEGLKENIDIDDGQLDMSSAKLNEHTASLGRQAVKSYEHNPRELKIAHYHLDQTEEGQPDDYFISKQMAFVAEPNMEVIDKNTGKVLARYVKNPDGSVSIKAGPATDIAGQELDEVMTLNEAKDTTGKFALNGASHNIQTLPPQATRTVILPSTKSHNDAALGTTWANTFNANTPVNKQIRELLYDIYTDIMDKHLNLLHSARVNPDKMRKLVKYHYKVLDDATGEVQKLINMSDKGVHHPNNLKIFKASIFNMLIANGGLKGRITIDRTKPNAVSEGMSTTLKLKQDKLGRIKLGQDGEAEGMMAGIDNDRLFNYAQDMYLREAAKTEQLNVQEFRDLPKEERVDIINSFLDTNNVMVQVSRQPIQHKGGVIFRKLMKFLPDVGNSMVMHVRDVAFHLLGDADGDTVSIAILPSDAQTNQLIDLINSSSFITDNFTADLGIFQHSKKTSPASYKEFTETMLSTIKYHNSQGLVTNIKTVASVMELKLGDNPIEFTDGIKVKVIKTDDYVVMDYAPLNNDVTEKDIPEFSSIVNRDGSKYKGTGTKYLRTTAAHERLILLNAATDNTKEHLLGKQWNMNMANIISRIYRREDGLNLKKEHVQLLKKLNVFFNYSDIRNARNKNTRRKFQDSDFYSRAEGIDNFLKNSSEGKLNIIRNLIKLPNKKIGIKDITISDNLTVDEILITRPYQKMVQDSEKHNANNTLAPWGTMTGAPMSFPEARYQNNHFATMNGYNDGETKIAGVNERIQELDVFKELTDEGRTAALNFLNDFVPNWLKHLGKKNDAKKKSSKEPTSQAYDYDKEMNSFLQPYLNKLNSLVNNHGESIRMMITYAQFKGIADVKRRNLLFPSEMLHPEVYKLYMETWENLFYAVNKKTGSLLISSTKAKTTTDQRVADITEGNKCD